MCQTALSGDVSVISSSTNTVIKTIDVGTNPQDIEYNPNNKNMYVANADSDDGICNRSDTYSVSS